MPCKSTSLPKLEMREGTEHASKVEDGIYPSTISYDPLRDISLMVLNSVLVGPNLTQAGGDYTAISKLGKSDQSLPKTTFGRQC